MIIVSIQALLVVRQCCQYSPSEKVTCGHLWLNECAGILLVQFATWTQVFPSVVITTKLQVTYVDEFCFIFRRAVALVLHKAFDGVRKQVADRFRLVAAHRHVHGLHLALVASYTRAAKVGERREHYSHARALHSMLSPLDLQQW